MNETTYAFTVKITVKNADGCGNRISPPNEGEVYRAIAKAVDYAESISVEKV